MSGSRFEDLWFSDGPGGADSSAPPLRPVSIVPLASPLEIGGAPAVDTAHELVIKSPVRRTYR